MRADPAIRAALDLYHLPSGIRAARRVPLPDGMGALLKIVAGEEAATSDAAALTERSVTEIRAAAIFFVEQILFAPDADSYRVLGANATDGSSEIRRNMALLLRWLHPDVRASAERAPLVERLTLAWEDLKTPERRANLDRRLADENLRRAKVRRSSHHRSHTSAASAIPMVTGQKPPRPHKGRANSERIGFFRRVVRRVLGRPSV